jgi:hypothetical protein
VGLALDRPLVRKRIEECRRGVGLVKSWKVNGTNSFIQIYLDGLRINFFLPTPDSVVKSPPHTHDLGFTSTILFGSFVNTILDVEEDLNGDYDRYQMCKPDALTFEFRDTQQRVSIVRQMPTTYRAGDTYSMDPREYHTTLFRDPTITYMRRWQEELVTTYHLVPVGRTIPPRPDRTVKSAELPGVWRTIDEMCARAGL